MAESTADRMFQVYLRGLSCEDIRRLNWGFSLGQIVDARHRYDWDRRRDEYDAALVIEGSDAIKRSQLEAALLAADMISAAAKLNRTRLHRFMQTGDEKDLGDLAIGSLRQLRESLEVLMKATRQDQPKGKEAAVEVPMPTTTASVTSVVRGIGEVGRSKKLARMLDRNKR